MTADHKLFDISVVGTAIARASVEQCWEVVRDSLGYANWVSFFTKAELIAPGRHGPNSVGALRKFYNKDGQGILEVVNIVHEPRVFGYRIADGSSGLKDHQGIVTLNPVPGGTELTWCMTANNDGLFSPGSGDVFKTPLDQAQGAMQAVIDITMKDLVAACEANAATAGAR
jgi:hypothetical protein